MRRASDAPPSASLSLHEGRQVVADSPGSFLGVGSRLVLPDTGESCRVLKARQIDPSDAIPALPSSSPVAERTPAQGENELSFFDSKARASVYLDPADGLTFYLWSGEPVAYVADDSIFGFNGKHLGWYHNGLVYDHNGDIVVAPATAFRVPVVPARARSSKRSQPAKGLEQLKPLKPSFGQSWSKVPARVFFSLGLG